jgi:hypothetical protein
MIEPRRRFCGRDFLFGMPIALPSAITFPFVAVFSRASKSGRQIRRTGALTKKRWTARITNGNQKAARSENRAAFFG